MKCDFFFSITGKAAGAAADDVNGEGERTVGDLRGCHRGRVGALESAESLARKPVLQV